MNRRALAFVLKAVNGNWEEALAFADRVQMTLFLRGAPGLPPWFEREIERRAARNAERVGRIEAACREVSGALHAAGVDFVFLKGLSHAAFGIDPLDRVQYDIDLCCAPGDTEAAARAIRTLGYEPHGTTSLSDQHLPPFVRPHTWQWRNDYFDPEMPIPIELHTTLWNDETDRIRLRGPEPFPTSVTYPRYWLTLDRRVAYAALHALRHVLRNERAPGARVRTIVFPRQARQRQPVLAAMARYAQ